MTLLESLQSLLAVETTASISKKLTSPDNFNDLLYKLCTSSYSAKEISPKTADRLRLLSKLWVITNRNFVLCQDIAEATRAWGEPATLASVASEYHAQGASEWPAEWNIRGTADFTAVKNSFRDRIYAAEPTAVLRGLVRQGVIQSPSTEARIGAVQIFDHCVSENIDITKQSARSAVEKFRRKPDFNSKDAGDAVGFFYTVQRLQAVVIEITQIQWLVQTGFRSAQEIAVCDDAGFASLVTTLGKENVQRIRQQALIIETRNEQTWTRLLQSRSNELDATIGPTTPFKGLSGDSGAQLTYQSIFREIDNASCSSCASVLSPSAYLVDLLRLMGATPIGPDKSTTLLNKFFERRGDIGTLALSCANTNDLINYIDLVHEVLQSFTASLAGVANQDKNRVSIHKNAAQYHAKAPFQEQQDVYFDFELHQKHIRKNVFPLANFPFNLGRTTSESFLAALGSSLPAVRSVFCSPHRIFAGALDSTPESSRKLPLATSVIERTIAADRLGLSQEDFVLLTAESFFSQVALELGQQPLSTEQYNKLIGLPGPHEQWGYTNEKEMLNNDETAESFGLSFVQRSLLPRLAITFDELLQLLRTQFVGHRLVLSPVGDKYTGRLEDIRLRMIPDQINATNTLTTVVCLDLIKFVRLWRKLMWPIEQLDIALTGLLRTGLHFKPWPGIDCSMLISLSWIKELKDATGLEVEELMPLWCDMDISHRKSLYYRLFCSQTKLRNAKLFQPAKDGTVFGHRAEVHDGLAVIANALDVTESELAQLLQICSITASDDLNLQNISKLYRYRTLGRILKLDVSQCGMLMDQKDGSTWFESPQRTHEAMKKWRGILSTGRSAADVLSVLHATYTSTTTAGTQKVKDVAEFARLYTETKTDLETRKLIETVTKKKYPEVDEKLLLLAIRQAPEAVAALRKSFADESVEIFRKAYLIVDGTVTFSATKAETNIDTTTLDGTKVLTASVSRRPSILSSLMPSWLADANVDEETWISQPMNLKKTQVHLLETMGDLRELWWDVNLAPHDEADAMDASLLRPVQRVRKLLEVVDSIFTLTKTIKLFDLGTEDMDFLRAPPRLADAIHVYQPKLEDLVGIAKYTELRSASKANTNDPLGLAIFMQSLPTNTSKMDNALVINRLAALTRTQPIVVTEILRQRYPAVPTATVFEFLKDLEEVGKLFEILKFFAKTRFTAANGKILFRLADPPNPLYANQEFDAAADLRSEVRSRFSQAPKNEVSLYSSTIRILVDRCRNALIQYLLRQEFMTKQNIVDSDGIFEYFLIDVNMGPGLQTSRIKQAISTVQLFIQRCILGMETKNGIKSTHIDQKRWDWCRSYRLWEANRRVFLYPENLADPTLRDDKSENFKALEAKIMQTNMDMERMTLAIKSYIYSLNDLSDLEIQAYLLQNQSLLHKIFHLFARTRNSPYVYFYRTFEFKKETSGTLPIWSPWKRIDIDIPTYETDAKGVALEKVGSYILPIIRKGRLYLFIPQILLKTLPTSTNADATINHAGTKTVSENSPDKYWEIRMGWSELRNGTWSTKKISQSCLNVNPLEIDLLPGSYNAKPAKQWKTNAMDRTRLPALDAFKFWLRSSDREGTIQLPGSGVSDVVIIDVECWYSTSPDIQDPISTSGSVDAKVYGLGRFELRDYDFTATPGSNFKDSKHVHRPASGGGGLQTTVPTKFSKLTWKHDVNKATQPNYDFYHASKLNAAILGPVDSVSSAKERHTTWTLSFDDTQAENATGLVAEAVTAEKGSQMFLTLPLKGVAEAKTANTLYSLDNTMGPFLMETCSRVDDLDGIYRSLSAELPTSISKEVFGTGSAPYYHELAQPYAVYNWEIGFHIVSLLMERLLATQQLELALQVARYVFDPTRDKNDHLPDPGKDKANKEPPKVYPEKPGPWLFEPFREPEVTKINSPARVVESLESKDSTLLSSAVDQWQKHPFAPHVVARAFPTAYMKRVVRKYIEILIAMGDQYFRQGDLESMPLAIQRYIEASHLFGPRPKTFERLGKSSPKNFHTLTETNAGNAFSNFAVELELEFPFWKELKYRGSSDVSPKLTEMNRGLLGILRTGYFCVPPNPELEALRDRIDDRLYKIRNCQDINGKGVQLRLFEPPLDVGALVKSVADGMPPSLLLTDSKAEPPRHRFTVLLQKALEMCNELKSMADQFLSLKEKEDAEAFTAFKSSQDDIISAMMLETKKLEAKEAQKSLESLQETRRSHETRLSFYRRLVGEEDTGPKPDQDWNDIIQDIDKPTMNELRMSRNEQLEFDLSDEANGLNLKASALDTIAGGLKALPGVEENIDPMGCGVSVHFDAGNFAEFMMITASVLKLGAEMKSHEADRAARKAQLIRQLQERRLQANLAGRDITTIDKQIAAQKIRIQMVESEISMQEKQIELSAAMDTWLKNKYTNKQLYNWMNNSLAKIFKDTYDVASSLALQAKLAYEFEFGNGPRPSIPRFTGYWDSARDGFFSAQNLWLDLKRLETAYMSKARHDFEITKIISLRQLDPMALLRFRFMGEAHFDIPEVVFDFDFPGQYLRRIQSIAISIPCIAGPYTGINCTLTLGKNSYRTKERDSSKDDRDQLPQSTVQYKQIATSHGQADTGVFDLNFGNDTYGPFEGAGAISSWTIKLPSPIPQFDYSSISDVVMHMKYTARDPVLKGEQCTVEAVKAFVTTQTALGLQVMIDVKSDYGFDWRDMNKALSSGQAPRTINIKDIRSRLPFWTRGRAISVGTVSLIVEVAEGEIPEIFLEGTKFQVHDNSVVTLTGKKLKWHVLRPENPEPPTKLLKLSVDKEAWELKVVKAAGSVELVRFFVVFPWAADSIS